MLLDKSNADTTSSKKICNTKYLLESIFTCRICCDEKDSAEKGIMCRIGKDHFICNECITDFVKNRNDDPRTSQFMEREGNICCPGYLIEY